MARKRKKKTKAQRRRIALRNLKKAHRARRRKGGHRKSRRRSKRTSSRRRKYGSRRRRSTRARHGHRGKRGTKAARKAAAAGVKVPSKAKIQDAYRRIIDRGGTEEHARKVVARLERMRTLAIRKGLAAHADKQRAEAQKKQAQDFADVFRKIGAEEARRASL